MLYRVWVCTGVCVVCVVNRSVRLVSNSSRSSSPVGDAAREGRLEVYYNGQWGTVCDHAFDNVAASVACRALGLSDT